MVICKYYLKNSCSFGTQCKNEHINVATVVKTDAEAAIKGKQWMLSSYGPFKDKPSLPNFEDQSFEEIRALCYEAKNNGNLQALLPQLSQQAADASYKISMLCDQNNVNNNLLNMLVNLYDTGESTGNTQSGLGTGNPFAVSSAVGGNQTSSLFGTPSTTQQQNPFGGSLFGNNKTTPSSGIFGGGNTSSSTTNSFFGQQSAFGSGGQSAFGGQQNAFGGQSTFGGNTTAGNNAFGTSSFGQPAASPFALSQIGQQPTEAPKPASSIFGASPFQQTQNSVFGAAPAFSNPIQPTKPSGLFGTGSMFGQAAAATPSGLFGQSNQPVNPPSGNIFSSFGASTQPQAQSQGLFGAVSDNKSMFGQSAISSNQSVFGGNQQQTNQSSNIFASAVAQQQSNTQNVFGVQQEQQPSIFGQSNSVATNIFQNQSNAAAASNIFQNQSNVPAVGSVFGGSVFGQPPAEQVNQSAYSKMEDLKPDDLQWFSAPNFVLGVIPTVPPPRELCVN